jgi:hypothetical protein
MLFTVSLQSVKSINKGELINICDSRFPNDIIGATKTEGKMGGRWTTNLILFDQSYRMIKKINRISLPFFQYYSRLV